ncbi:MAG: excinuclease ABC subunit UvrA [Oscillospiraceae bacterium]|jgi:excinuclease ABC subunit A|nr:excinuclease ABC subunit UvrA [Oscillospiraceae bacterium]
MFDKIIIKGARENNLKNINVEFPRDKLVVMTGVSGSGKSSLAFDTIYADGQRRYMESLSSYARQFLGQMEKPDVDSIEGLSPAISIDQKTTSKNPRSTVGTVTEIYDYLRLLYARIGIPHCPICGRVIKQQTVDQITDDILSLPENSKIILLSPIAKGKKGEYKQEFESVKKAGFVRVRVDGIIYDLSENISLDKNKKHTIEIVVDRLVIKSDIKSRLSDSLETVFKYSEGMLNLLITGEEEEIIEYSLNYACPEHGFSMDELTPRMFSFNNPFGACEKCTGLGAVFEIDPESVIPNPNLTIAEGAIQAIGWNSLDENSIAMMYYKAIAKKYDISLRVPVKDLPKEVLNVFLYGSKGQKLEMQVPSHFGGGIRKQVFEGVINNMQRRYKETTSEYSKEEIRSNMSEKACSECGGDRLKKEILAVTVGGINITQLTRKSITDCVEFFENLQLTDREKFIAHRIVKEIKERLHFLKNVGLEYLTLARSSGSLSGGESQRIRLATQIGSMLTGVLYVLDEPSIGLHQRDNDKLIETLKHLRDLGNTLIVVEHDDETMLAADYIVDIGPGAGIHGGEVIFSGTVKELMKAKNSLTAEYLADKFKIPCPKVRRQGNGNFLEVYGASENNLKDIDVKIPLNTFTCVTGVSGSGKSSLVNEVILKYLSHKLNRTRSVKWGKFKSIKGLEFLDKVIAIDQAPIGRTPRSNAATYTNVFNDIRELYASTNDAKARGYKIGRFSFNTKGGRCEACQGDGIIKMEMHFLPDIYVPCEVCKGKRYNRETLEVYYKGKNIYDILDMTIDECVEFFENIPKISRKMRTLQEVGLGYIKAGQPATTLSGGEAQRVKLAAELSKRATGKTLYILDEPTTGLHNADVHKLIDVLQKLVENGDTVLVIEHNLNVIKVADYIIDLGPEGGDKGGELIAGGTPEELVKIKKSYTGLYLKEYLKKKKK